MLRLSLAAAALAAVLPATAQAQRADPDVRCMMVSNIFAAKETDAKRRQVAFVAVAFYLGRIDARLSPAQTRASILILGKEKVGQDVGQTMTACARAMQVKQVAVGQTLQQLGKEQAAAAKPK